MLNGKKDLLGLSNLTSKEIDQILVKATEMKKIVMALAIVIFFMSPFVFAESEQVVGHDHGMMQKGDMQNEQKDLVDVGNKICPVSGEEIKEESKATYEYEGKIYNFCCPMCIDEFKKDPEKYIKRVDEELKKESE